MQLDELLAKLDRVELTARQAEIVAVVCDSRLVTPGTLFVAIEGEKADGHDHVAAALAAGAAACFVSDCRLTDLSAGIICFEDTRAAMAMAARLVYGDPAKDRLTVAVTGTNGKTTTTHIIEAILAAQGVSCGVLGTIAYRLGGFSIEASHTTPQSCQLQAVLAELAQRGAAAFAMEASSHALEQGRLRGVSIDCAVFTNLTRDHLDYHGDMERYFAAKKLLFNEFAAGAPAVINIDDSFGVRLAGACRGRTISYGFAPKAAITIESPQSTINGSSGVLVTPCGRIALKSPLVGRFNLYNIMAAAGACFALGVPLSAIAAGIERMPPVPGRMEPVGNDLGVGVYVDYAHTGDALENVLKTARELTAGKLLVMFGCGGDRDRGKRPIMGELAARLADIVVITSDNPRSEAPDFIIGEILNGIRSAGLEPGSARCLVEPDRAAAIRAVIGLAAPGDVVVLAGKGHEDYQIIGTIKQPFDDRLVAAAVLAA